MKNFKEFLNEELKLGSKERIHNSLKDIIELKIVKKQNIGAKPAGLWYGFGNSWIKWVRTEMPEWEFENFFKLKLDTKRIIKLSTKNEYKEFTEKYKGDDEAWTIDWNEVAKNYGGIELNPYQKYFKWCGTWDVDSGCVWDKDVIIDIKKINKINEKF